jgi:hypothetical protein
MMTKKIELALFYLIITTSLYGDNVYENYYRERIFIRQISDNSNWIIRYSKDRSGSVIASGYESATGNFIKFQGNLIDPLKEDILSIGSYKELVITHSSVGGQVYKTNLFDGASDEVHISHEYYASFLRDFSFFSLENKMEDSPFKYLKFDEIPEILLAAREMIPEKSKLSYLLDERFAPIFGFSYVFSLNSLKIQFVAENTQAFYAGLEKGDRIINITQNFTPMELEGFREKISDENVQLFHLWIKRESGDRKIIHKVVKLYRTTEIERRLFSPNK